jgi:hypothetical protein
MFGKRVSDYFAFGAGPFVFVATVGILRLGLSLAGAPVHQIKWLSVTAALLASFVYFGVRVHTSAFGSYRQLLPLSFFASLIAQGISALGVAIAIWMGTDNIFSIPEYAGGDDGKTWFHAGAHLGIATPIVTLLGWGLASLIMLATKRVTRRPALDAAAEPTPPPMI